MILINIGKTKCGTYKVCHIFLRPSQKLNGLTIKVKSDIIK